MPKPPKAVKKRLAFLEQEVLLQRALQWTVPPAAIFPSYVHTSAWCHYDVGWAINVTTFEIYRAWSSNKKHGRGEAPSSYSGRAGALALFATRLEAAQALRHAYERVAALQLVKLDELIDKERGV